MKKVLFFIIAAILAYLGYLYIQYLQTQKTVNLDSKNQQLFQSNIVQCIQGGGNPFMTTWVIGGKTYTSDDVLDLLIKLRDLPQYNVTTETINAWILEMPTSFKTSTTKIRNWIGFTPATVINSGFRGIIQLPAGFTINRN